MAVSIRFVRVDEILVLTDAPTELNVAFQSPLYLDYVNSLYWPLRFRAARQLGLSESFSKPTYRELLLFATVFPSRRAEC